MLTAGRAVSFDVTRKVYGGAGMELSNALPGIGDAALAKPVVDTSTLAFRTIPPRSRAKTKLIKRSECDLAAVLKAPEPYHSTFGHRRGITGSLA